MEPSPEAISIVVIGAMNPRIHQPHWYSGTNIISIDDLQVAIQGLIAVPRITQFTLDHIRITCQDDRWELFAEGKESFARGVEIADATWSKLPETPVSSYGLNFMSSFQINNFSASDAMSSLLSPEVASLSGTPLGAEFRVIGTEPGLGQITVDLRPSDQPKNTIAVSINYHFTLDEAEGYFDLGSAITSKYNICLTSAELKLASILSLFQNLHRET